MSEDSKRTAHDDYFRLYLNRTIMLLGEEAVQTLRRKTVAVAGCGGQGGAACLTLARMGVGKFILADPKPFDEPDINRQWGANRTTLGRNKAEVYEEMLWTINPEIEVTKFCDGITNDNVPDFLAGADLLIDCLDIAVPGALRNKVFATARANGIHAFTAAMIGFGGMIAGSYPGGLSLEVLGDIEDSAITGSKLPEGLRDIFVGDHLDKIEASLSQHRVPSIAVSPAILGVVLSVESVLALLGNTFPGWRPPLCLPQLLLVDLLRMNFKVVELDQLVLQRKKTPETPPKREARSVVSSGISVEERVTLLRSAGYNTNFIPHHAVEIDLTTDSWSEIHQVSPESMDDETEQEAGSLVQKLQGLYGYKFVMPVFRGRFAEALLCKALARDKKTILANVLFPTTRFHLETNGYSVQEMVLEKAYLPDGDHPFKGNIDLSRLEEALRGSERVGAIYLETCVNALGGHPISLANLADIRRLTQACGVPVFLDAARIFENAALIRAREPGYSEYTLVRIVRDLCALTDGSATSCAKDFPVRVGGFIGTNDERLYLDLSDLTLATGDGLTEENRAAFARALARAPEGMGGSKARLAQVELLWKLLRDESVPVVVPAGGHAVFVDACALLPHVPFEQFPAQAFANALYSATGVRAATNFTAPGLERRQIQLLRLAIPIGCFDDETIRSIARSVGEVARSKERITGLRRVGGGEGAAAEFAGEFRPLASSPP